MRFFLFTFIPLVAAFAPANLNEHRIQTKLGVDRRDAFLKAGAAALATIVGLPQTGKAVQERSKQGQYGGQGQYGDRGWSMEENKLMSQSQGAKFDLNRSYASDYKSLKGMYPSAAEKLASNGPYKSVQDIYRIKDLTEQDKQLFRNYESTFTVSKAFDRDWSKTGRVVPRGQQVEINSSNTGDYKNLGMNLSAAEKLANNGPYKSVKDIYKIKNLTDREKEMFREYENYFTVDKSFYQDRQMSS